MRQVLRRLLTACGWCLLACGLASAQPHTQTVDDLVRQSRELAAKSQHQEALRLLSSQEQRFGQDLGFKLAYARILAWSGRYAESETRLQWLTAAERENPDAILLKADLEFYQARHEQAIASYRLVLSKVPDYVEAQDGLTRALAARQAQAAVAVAPASEAAKPAAPEVKPPQWALTLGGEYSQFDQAGRLSWRQQSVQLDRLRDGLSPYARWVRYDQYGLLDMETDVGFNWAPSAHLTLNAGASMVHQPMFKPERRLYLNVEQLLLGEVARPLATWGTLQWRDEAYADGARVVTINPGLAFMPYAGIKLSANMITVDKSDAARLYGRSWRVDVTPSDAWSWHVGYADAPENELSRVVRTKTWFAGLTLDILPQYTVRLGYARDDRVDSYIRQVINASVTRRF